MNGWLICSGLKDIEKISILVNKLLENAKKLGYELELIESSDIIPYFDELCKPKVKLLKNVNECDYIIFWDKDIYLGKHLEQMGYRLFNNCDAIAKCDDKLLMHQSLAGSGIRIPKTIIGPFTYFKHSTSLDSYNNVIDLLGENFILKESQGSFGMQVYMITSYVDYCSTIESLGNKRYLMQENISYSFGRDVRINIIGDTIVGAMERANENDFRANITLGGIGELVELDEKQKEIALTAHKCLGLDFCGLDLLFGEDGNPILCEVNSNVNYISYEKIAGVNFSKLLLEYIERSLK